VLAQTAATLAELTSGPVLLGVGTSVPAHVTGLNQLPFDRPVARLRDTVAILAHRVRG
jgi:alkanesulfonate monooxygenase SsuD/methylene tetrahydromethanopterin reductase-like flavin-dependent oxidoreductase (luciferase family)